LSLELKIIFSKRWKGIRWCKCSRNS